MAINFKEIVGGAVANQEQFRIFTNVQGRQVLRTFTVKGRQQTFVDRFLAKQEEVHFDDVPH